MYMLCLKSFYAFYVVFVPLVYKYVSTNNFFYIYITKLNNERKMKNNIYLWLYHQYFNRKNK